METKDVQKMAVGLVDELDVKFKVERDAQLNFTQLIEEVGELAKDINLPKLRHKEPDRTNLEGEFADVFFLLAKAAEMNNVDLEEAVKNKIIEVRERYLSE